MCRIDFKGEKHDSGTSIGGLCTRPDDGGWSPGLGEGIKEHERLLVNEEQTELCVNGCERVDTDSAHSHTALAPCFSFHSYFHP